jgi:hypothetical protein
MQGCQSGLFSLSHLMSNRVRRVCLPIFLAWSATAATADDSGIQAQISSNVVRLLTMEDADSDRPFGPGLLNDTGVLISVAV